MATRIYVLNGRSYDSSFPLDVTQHFASLDGALAHLAKTRNKITDSLPEYMKGSYEWVASNNDDHFHHAWSLTRFQNHLIQPPTSVLVELTITKRRLHA